MPVVYRNLPPVLVDADTIDFSFLLNQPRLEHYITAGGILILLHWLNLCFTSLAIALAVNQSLQVSPL